MINGQGSRAHARIEDRDMVSVLNTKILSNTNGPNTNISYFIWSRERPGDIAVAFLLLNLGWAVSLADHEW